MILSQFFRDIKKKSNFTAQLNHPRFSLRFYVDEQFYAEQK